MKNIFCLVFILVQIVQLQAQSDTLYQDTEAYISMSNIIFKVKYSDDAIHLRWAPDNAIDWQRANRYGYIVQRKVFNKKMAIDTADYITISDTIKPLTIDAWSNQVRNSDNPKYSAIAMQSIYDKSETTVGSKTLKDFYTKKDLLNTRFGFCLFAADVDKEAAKNAGLSFIDTDIEKGKQYEYRIEHLIPIQISQLSAAAIIIDTDAEDLAPAVDVLLRQGDHKITLMWNREVYDQYYTAYIIERRLPDGKFERLDNEYYIQGYDDEKIFYNKYITYRDSLFNNNIDYEYRVAGVDIFGDMGSYSPIKKGHGIDITPPQAPVKLSAQYDKQSSTMTVTWKYDQSIENLQGFNIMHRIQDMKSARRINELTISTNERSYSLEIKESTDNHYFSVAVVDIHGNQGISAEVKGYIVDDEPPIAPTNLTARIDSTGIVSLAWDWGQEEDILGYKVFFANQHDHEFALKTGHAIPDSIYQDTITLGTLTRNAYYRVMAVDQSFNYSKMSEIIKVVRPDIIRPNPPVFDDYEVRGSSVYLHWARSSSDDVSHLTLIKKTINTDWKTVIELSPSTNNYIDSNIEYSGIYDYAIFAMDSVGLVSDTIRPIRIITSASKIPPVSNVQIVINAETDIANLSWSHPMLGDIKFVIYKEIEGEGYNLLKVNTSDKKILYDGNIQKGKKYNYAIKVMHDDGRKSKFSEVVSLKI